MASPDAFRTPGAARATSSRRNVFRVLVDAFVEARQRNAEAAIIRGGLAVKITDDTERRMAEILLPPGGFHR